MSLEAGSICLFNCDQNGRDLPEDNESYYNSEGKKCYKCGCPHHYFLILSSKENNEFITTDFSKMLTSEDSGKKKLIKLCSAVPIDVINSNNQENEYAYQFEDMDLIENENNSESNKLIKSFLSRENIVLCNQICKISVSQLKTQRTPFFIGSDAFNGVLQGINKYLKMGHSQTKKREN
jgi:hypothetical protein